MLCPNTGRHPQVYEPCYCPCLSEVSVLHSILAFLLRDAVRKLVTLPFTMAPKVLHAEDAAIAREEAPELPYVDWKKSPGLRRLYMYATVIMVASATTGYDG